MSASNELQADLATDDEQPLDAVLAAAATKVAKPAAEAAPGEISTRIAAILDSAEEEAEKIREQARAEASSIVRAAHASAAGRIDELTREPQRLRDEAELEARRLLDQARGEAAAQVADAERQAAALTREAEKQAADLRRDAERAASEMEAEMERRRRELKGELEALAQLREQAGASVQEVVQVLQRTASDIDRRLGAVPSSEAEQREPAADSPKSALRLLSRRGSEE